MITLIEYITLANSMNDETKNKIGNEIKKEIIDKMKKIDSKMYLYDDEINDILESINLDYFKDLEKINLILGITDHSKFMEIE